MLWRIITTDNMVTNPINRREIAYSTILPIGIFIFGWLWIYLEYGFKLYSVVIGLAVALFVFMIIGIRTEIYDRPKEVEVIDAGIVLHQRLGRKPVFAPWSDISKVSHMMVIKPGKESRTNSYLGVLDKKRYTITREIAAIIRERYRERFGVYPFNRMDAGTNSVRK